jgi:hypothetical protein
MEDWEFTQGFYCGLSKEAKEHIDTLGGGTFFMLNAKEVWALFEKLSASERESEEHGLKENSCIIKIDPLTRKFQGMPLTQPVASETHQAEQEILAQPSDGKKMPMSRISSDAILDKLQNRISGPTLPQFVASWGLSRSIMRSAIGEPAWTSCPWWSMTTWKRTHWSLPLINCDWQTPL